MGLLLACGQVGPGRRGAIRRSSTFFPRRHASRTTTTVKPRRFYPIPTLLMGQYFKAVNLDKREYVRPW